MVNKYFKRCSTSLSEKWKLKEDTTMHSLECLKLKRLTPNVGKDVKQLEFLYTAVRTHIDITILEDSLAVITEYMNVLWTNNFIAGYTLNRNVCPQKTCTRISIAILYTMASNRKQSRCPSNSRQRMDVETVYSSREILQRNVTEWTATPNNMGESQNYDAEGKKPDTRVLTARLHA